MQQIHASNDESALLDGLAGETCEFCAGGTLVRGEYKGNDAVVCSDCEPSTIQLF